jgi:hypothetical protein
MGENMMSTTAIGGAPAQTPENMVPPHESLPTAAPITEAPKKKSTGFTKEMRAAKIAAGWKPPNYKPPVSQPQSTPDMRQEGPQTTSEKESVELLRALVKKLVALENNEQYRSVWSHFFVHGGVYNGPRYMDELNAAIGYLIRTGVK